MKVSYNILKKYLPFLENPEQTAQNLIMHTAEVEEIEYQNKSFENIVCGKIIAITAHENADSLQVCTVDVGEDAPLQIVCGGSNLSIGQTVAVAKIGASVVWHGEGEPIIMKKTSIRGVESYGMICASEEIGLKEQFPAKDGKEILDLSHIETKPGTGIAEILEKDDAILHIDNKAINHRPDMFSYIGVIRELAVIHRQKTSLEYILTDFKNIPEIGIQKSLANVKRYIGLEISGVKNIPTEKKEILQVLNASENASKGILIDVTNYSLFFYGQPTHCFDKNKINGGIIIRYGKPGEKFLALDNKEYELCEEDIVIADDTTILALGGIIGGKESAVSETTTDIVIESANFPGDILRKTGRRLGIRTDALNIFEKNPPAEFASRGISLVYETLKEIFPNATIKGYTDIYTTPDDKITIPVDVDFIRNLIGVKYEEETIDSILSLLGIEKKENMFHVPFWRKDTRYKSDIAEEVARIDGYNKVPLTTPRIDIGAQSISRIVQLKRDIRNFFTVKGFFEMYNYSFVNKELMGKLGYGIENLIEMKNYLSEEITHLRNSVIPLLLLGIEKNARDHNTLKLIECEKTFHLIEGEVKESYHLGGVITSEEKIVYYKIQNIVADFFKTIGVDKYSFEKTGKYTHLIPNFCHKGRTAVITIRGQMVGFVGEIHPFIASNFDSTQRIGFFEINAEKLSEFAYNKVKAIEISSFQENNFDITFVVNKSIAGGDVAKVIQKTHPNIIKKVELFDIYEDETKLPGQRSISFKVYIKSETETLDDTVKSTLIKQIIDNVKKVGGTLRA